ncbi:class I SAM-dependent methyltransferase [Sphingomonas sp. MJ1 (PH-R8)]|uniref:class I SAM-dependent methyltransferase n=1 Tax=Sphingomonas sp. MJ1 (PH-R8) TaxID=3112950 RepID=UPI003A86482F
MTDVLTGYAEASAELIARFEAISTRDLLAPVADLLPVSPARIADIGAGTGRDAAWFASQGHHVLAVEPVEELRAAGMALHGDRRIAWLDDRLPDLVAARREPAFDLVTACAVWQHLDEDDRAVGIRHLAGMTADGGLLILSLRHGAGAPSRRVFPVDVERIVAGARENGFDIVRVAEAASLQAGNQAAGVKWTWLALRKVR